MNKHIDFCYSTDEDDSVDLTFYAGKNQVITLEVLIKEFQAFAIAMGFSPKSVSHIVIQADE